MAEDSESGPSEQAVWTQVKEAFNCANFKFDKLVWAQILATQLLVGVQYSSVNFFPAFLEEFYGYPSVKASQISAMLYLMMIFSPFAGWLIGTLGNSVWFQLIAASCCCCGYVSLYMLVPYPVISICAIGICFSFIEANTYNILLSIVDVTGADSGLALGLYGSALNVALVLEALATGLVDDLGSTRDQNLLFIGFLATGAVVTAFMLCDSRMLQVNATTEEEEEEHAKVPEQVLSPRTPLGVLKRAPSFDEEGVEGGGKATPKPTPDPDGGAVGCCTTVLVSVLLGLISSTLYFSYHSIGGLEIALEKDLDFSAADVALLFDSYSFPAIFVPIIVGFMLSKTGHKPIAFTLLLTILVGNVIVTTSLYAFPSNPLPMMCIGRLFVGGAAESLIVFHAYVADFWFYGTPYYTMALGTILAVAQILGSFSTFFVLGDIADAVSLQFALWLVVGSTVFSIVMFLIYTLAEYAFMDYLTGPMQRTVNVFPGLFCFCATPTKMKPKENSETTALVAP